MPAANRKTDNFDLKLAEECALAFSRSTELGCTVSDAAGAILYEAGHGCVTCGMCEAAGIDPAGCAVAHVYGMTEAERFGGKYIYFCPMGLTCFVSPILGRSGSAAKMTVGPFLMVDREDYIELDLVEKLRFSLPLPERIAVALDKIPQVSPEKVNSLSVLLFMAVSFLNNVSAANRMLDAQASEMMQGQIGAYILELKKGDDARSYPFATERALLAAIAESDRELAQALLNELLGHILFSSGGDLDRMKSRVYELLVLMSRAAMDAGASQELSFEINHRFFLQSHKICGIDELCFLIADVINRFVDSIFRYSGVRHMDVIHKAARYVRQNISSRVTLEEVAQQVYLSPSYFSKIFKKEMGMSFNAWLNGLRIEKSKRLLLEDIRLADIAGMTGFEDQSYFSKVFKRVTGVSPNRYRETNGRG